MMLITIALVFVLGILGAESRAQREGIPGSNSVGSDVPVPRGTCLCTPFYACFDEESSSNLDGIVNDRSSLPTITAKQANEPNGQCSDILEVCCHNLVLPSVNPTSNPSSPQPVTSRPLQISTTPSSPVTAGAFEQPPPIHEEGACGVRNANGIDFSVDGFQEGQAQYGEFPWTVAVLTANTGFGLDMGAKNLFVGGGSLIHPRVVLTAAHKDYDLEAGKSFVVRLGEWNFAATTEPTPHQDITVSRVITHHRFDRHKRIYNLALLILEQEAQLGETVKTVCIPSINENFDGQDCFVSGWGKNVFGDEGRYSRIMKSVKVNMVEQGQCESALETTVFGNRNFSRSFICAGDKGQDSCTGDGGSPLVCPHPTSRGQYVQVGLASWGIGCGQQGIPGVYARVYAEDFIQKQMIKVNNGDYFDTDVRVG